MSAAVEIETIKLFIKKDILIERLEIEADGPDTVDEDVGLFDPDGIGLDSVEALEMIAALEGRFGISFQGLPRDLIRKNFYSVSSLAGFVHAIAQGVRFETEPAAASQA